MCTVRRIICFLLLLILKSSSSSSSSSSPSSSSLPFRFFSKKPLWSDCVATSLCHLSQTVVLPDAYNNSTHIIYISPLVQLEIEIFNYAVCAVTHLETEICQRAYYYYCCYYYYYYCQYYRCIIPLTTTTLRAPTPCALMETWEIHNTQ